jgi:hypothetical protein
MDEAGKPHLLSKEAAEFALEERRLLFAEEHANVAQIKELLEHYEGKMREPEPVEPKVMHNPVTRFSVAHAEDNICNNGVRKRKRDSILGLPPR